MSVEILMFYVFSTLSVFMGTMCTLVAIMGIHQVMFKSDVWFVTYLEDIFGI